MARLAKPRIAKLDEVQITRLGEEAVIDYRDPGIGGVNLLLGPEVQSMTDQDILDRLNQVLRVQEQLAQEYEHIAVEIPPGWPQVRYHRRAGQWVPQGHVVRCVVDDGGPDGEVTFYIDDREFSLQEFGGLVRTFAGWGMRICFVPDDEICNEPSIEVRRPEESET